MCLLQEFHPLCILNFFNQYLDGPVVVQFPVLISAVQIQNRKTSYHREQVGSILKASYRGCGNV